TVPARPSRAPSSSPRDFIIFAPRFHARRVLLPSRRRESHLKISQAVRSHAARARTSACINDIEHDNRADAFTRLERRAMQKDHVALRALSGGARELEAS